MKKEIVESYTEENILVVGPTRSGLGSGFRVNQSMVPFLNYIKSIN